MPHAHSRMINPCETIFATSPRVLHLILLVTEQCNFRCNYCYEAFHRGRMKDSVVKGVKKLLSERAPELDSLVIGMFGGEPLCAKGVVYDIANHAASLAERHDFELIGNVTTNAYDLDVDTMQRCIRGGLTQFQITLDGYGEVHDASRIRADGHGTFDSIWTNLKRLRETELPFEITLRVHYSPDSYLKHGLLLDAINRTFAFDPRFRVLFRGVERLGGQNDSQIARFDRETEKAIEEKLYAGLSDPGLRARVGHKYAYVCYASRPNSLVIRSDGKIVKCTVCLDDDRNVVGSIREDGCVHLDAQKMSFWARGYSDMNTDVLGCPAKGLNPHVKNEQGKISASPQTLYQLSVN